MTDLGASLAAARETRGLSLADAERLTNIRVRHLAALERSDYDALPGRTYARAFLRTYARALDLDADKLVAGFEELVPNDELEDAAPSPRRQVPVRRFAVVASVVGVFAVVAWAGMSSHGNRTPPPAHAAPPVVSPPAAPVVRHPVTTIVATPPTHSAALVVSATRGRCWMLVRAGGTPNGQVLFEGMLELGQSKRFTEPKLWIRFGAPGSVEVKRGGSAVSGLGGLTPIDVIA